MQPTTSTCQLCFLNLLASQTRVGVLRTVRAISDW
jgi:hypothetical protein